MGFKENLLKRITINDLVQVVGKTIGTANSGAKVDKKTMKQLLDMSLFDHQNEREMDLYLKPLAAEGAFQILVLDNDMVIYTPGNNQLVLWPHAINRLDLQAVEQLSGTIEALKPPWVKEVGVLAFLRDKALEQGRMTDMGSTPV